jgi:SAM-dependent methyltransferase
MMKYVLSAAALKCFSAAPPMRRLYRELGNLVGNRRRGTGRMPPYYVERVRKMLRAQSEYKLLRDGDQIMELGTGWLHWEALTTRLFFDVHSVVFDVWDNRQLNGLKNYAVQLGPMLKQGGDLGLSAAEATRAQRLIEKIAKVGSFEELYELLGFEYAIESSGSLARFPSERFQLVVSGGVLEHVDREALPLLANEMFRVLKPGGWAMHSIDIQDHLSYYDRTVSKKEYLMFSEPMWKYFFQNRVQYINRVQRNEWLELFRAAGFELVDEDGWRVNIPAKVAKRYAKMDRRDLECGGLKVLFKKPV